MTDDEIAIRELLAQKLIRTTVSPHFPTGGSHA